MYSSLLYSLQLLVCPKLSSYTIMSVLSPPPPLLPTTFVLTYCLVIFLLLLDSTKCQANKTTNTGARRSPRQLSVDYYAKSCPQAEQLIGSVTSQQFEQAPVSAPATIRLFFHDCFVEGCDASILISAAKPGSNVLPEKYAEDNKDLREEGFETVRKAKALVESKCPGVVSCADILAVAARDFVHLVCLPLLQLSMTSKSVAKLIKLT